LKDDIGVDLNDVNTLAESMGIPFKVQVSTSLFEQLKPNEYLAALGIQYPERIKNLLSALKGSLIPKSDDLEGTLPKRGVVIPLALAIGPLIKEELVFIKAELTDDGGEDVIILTPILGQN